MHGTCKMSVICETSNNVRYTFIPGFSRLNRLKVPNAKLMVLSIKRYMDKWYPYLVINQVVNTYAVEMIALRFPDSAYTSF